MTYYTPMAAHWYQVWREHIGSAKSNPNESWVYCASAALAQTNYVMALALKE